MHASDGRGRGQGGAKCSAQSDAGRGPAARQRVPATRGFGGRSVQTSGRREEAPDGPERGRRAGETVAGGGLEGDGEVAG